jgi:hypothetical protein
LHASHLVFQLPSSYEGCEAASCDFISIHLSFKNESVQYTIRICLLYEIDSDLGSQPVSVMLGRRPVEPGYQTAMRRHASRTSKESQYSEGHIVISVAFISLLMRKGYSGRTSIGHYFSYSTLVSSGSLFLHFQEAFVASKMDDGWELKSKIRLVIQCYSAMIDATATDHYQLSS